MKQKVKIGDVRKAKIAGCVINVKVLGAATPKTYDVQLLGVVDSFSGKVSKATIHENDFV